MTTQAETDICDSEAARLLPWLVTGRLDAGDVAHIEEHVASCPICRADRDEQYRLRDLVEADDRIEYSPQPALQKLISRIDEMDREMPAAVKEDDAAQPPQATRSVASVPRWLLAAMVVQTIGLGLLGAAVWRHAGTDPAAANYETLSSAPVSIAGAPRIRVVFAPVTTLGELAGLLGSVGGTVVAGPSEAGAYTLAFPDGQAHPGAVAAHLARLRADPRVLFAEPVAGTTDPSR